jgi:glutamate-1-semialdehyde 2,1-aminomutase
VKLDASRDAFECACTVSPGGVHSPVRAFRSVGGTPIFFDRAEGARVRDLDGNEYVDFCLSWGPLILGHAHPGVVAAVREAAGRGLSYGACHLGESRLAAAILKGLPDFDRVRLVSSGTEAVMTALRLARGATGRSLVLKFEGGYHGHLDSLLVQAGSGLATLGTSSSAGVPEAIARTPLVAPLADPQAVRALFDRHGDDIACVAIEPIPANNGLLPQSGELLALLRELCDRHGSLLLFDEVITGFRLRYGTCAPLLDGAGADVRPDLVTLGKIVGGGMPIGAVSGRADLLDRLAPLGPVYQAGTLSGNPVSCAAGLATLEVLREQDPYPRLEALGARLQSRLESGGPDGAPSATRPCTVGCSSGVSTWRPRPSRSSSCARPTPRTTSTRSAPRSSRRPQALTERRPRANGARTHHFFFGLALGLLVALAAWWIVLMSRTVGAEDRLARERLRLEAALHATLLAADPAARPRPGPLPDDPELEIVPAGPGAGAPIGRTGLSVRPVPRLLGEQDATVRRKRLMVIGEGSLMLLLVGSCVLMLYRLVDAERRYRRDVDHFLSRVTHEMKTPLAGVKALLESVRDGRVPAERLPRLAALGLKQAERQEHLIQNLLTAQRVASGAGAVTSETLDVSELLDSFVHHRRETMALAEDRYELDCPEGLQARGNAGAIVTILENLADNADKYGAHRLSLSARLDGDRVRVVVADDGEGFEPADAATLFRAFRRGATGTPAARHGTGLGLHISRELAREMGGDLRAASEGRGRGATFTLELPAPGASAAEGAAA